MEYGSLTSVARPKSGELISICMCVSRSNKGTLRLKVELVTLGIIGAVIFLRCTAKYSSKDSGAYTGTPSSLKMYDPAYPSSHACWPFRSEEHTSELQSHYDLVCRLLLEKKNKLDFNTSYNFSLCSFIYMFSYHLFL